MGTQVRVPEKGHCWAYSDDVMTHSATNPQARAVCLRSRMELHCPEGCLRTTIDEMGAMLLPHCTFGPAPTRVVAPLPPPPASAGQRMGMGIRRRHEPLLGAPVGSWVGAVN